MSQQEQEPDRMRMSLKRMNGDYLEIEISDDHLDLNSVVYHALPEEERPIHPGKIKVIQEDGESYLWIHPADEFLQTDILGVVELYPSGEVLTRCRLDIWRETDHLERIYFYYCPAPKNDPDASEKKVQDRIYRASDVIERGRPTWRHEEEIEIPEDVRPITPEQLLGEWSDLHVDLAVELRDLRDKISGEYWYNDFEEDVDRFGD